MLFLTKWQPKLRDRYNQYKVILSSHTKFGFLTHSSIIVIVEDSRDVEFVCSL